MCGRFTIRKPVTKTVDIVKTNIKVEDNDNYNAHPTQQLPIIKSYTNGKALELCEWGLVPAWSKKLDKFSPLINARKETLMEKVTFKNLIQTSRCIVPADGYYEWKRHRSVNQPYYLQLSDESVFYMAGIWETWHDPAGVPTESFAILTTQANALAAKVHDRMPVILEGDDTLTWLDGNPDIIETDKRFDLLGPIDSSRMKCRPVNPIVNNNQNDVPECISEPPVETSTQLDMGF